LQKQLQAYRAGTRQNALMQAVAEVLSDEEISELAAFYSSQRMAYCW
jgi:cytochrome c553